MPDDFKQERRAIISAETRLQQDKAGVLIKHGWKYNSEFPDHCQRWFKMIDGQRFTTSSMDEALSIQAYLKGT